MKYGLWYFKDTHNLGDDIWAYAQSLFYPRVDYLIDNTTSYKFKSDNDEQVATIMAAFVEPYNREYAFAPPINLSPLFVGAYFRSTMWEFIETDFVREYLKAHEPIGVRSCEHSNQLRAMGIEAYFSGCITLTLPEISKKTGNYICCVDVPDYVIDKVRKITKDQFEIKRMTHISPLFHNNSSYTREWEPEFSRSITYEQRQNLSINERFEITRSLLQFYANSHCVITSRLHAALPCLSQSTPVLFTLPKDGSEVVDMDTRCGDFLPLLHHSSYEDFNADTVDYDFINPPGNPTEFLRFRKIISDRCSEFIESCEADKVLNRCPYTAERRSELLIDILENKVLQLKKLADTKNLVISNMTEA